MARAGEQESAYHNGWPLIKISILIILPWFMQNCVLSAERAPVVVLCLGADVELYFRRWSDETSVAIALEPLEAAYSSTRGLSPVSTDGPPPVSDLRVISSDGLGRVYEFGGDEEEGADPGAEDEPMGDPIVPIDKAFETPAEMESASTSSAVRGAKKAPRNAKDTKPKGKVAVAEEVLMVTLVHGDMLVVEGGVFRVSVVVSVATSKAHCSEPVCFEEDRHVYV